MNYKTLVTKGYFPKELPPPFNTEMLGKKCQLVNTRWAALMVSNSNPKPGETTQVARQRFKTDFINKYDNSKLLEYNLAKGIFSRRKLGIPHPKQFIELCQILTSNWDNIKRSLLLEHFSESSPIFKKSKRAAQTKSISLNNFKFKRIESSFNKRYELTFDISQFYPSIYTHSITWAILGKDDAKIYFKKKQQYRNTWASVVSTDPKAALYDLSDKIDTCVRNCQEKQSIGLPIGPDTSFLIAELIGSRIDNEIWNQIKNIDYCAIRYYDDYYFYVNNYGEAERILKIAQQVLSEFSLETNESKVKIKEMPISFEKEWTTDISRYSFTNVSSGEIVTYFSIINNHVEKYPVDSSWIINYALSRFEFGNVIISKANWNLFLSLLLGLLKLDPSNIDQFLKIALSYNIYSSPISKKMIGKILHSIIDENLSLNHSFEVSWALWSLKSLEIKCNSILLNKVLSSSDDISILICLDLIHSRLYTGRKPKISKLSKSINSNDLFSQHWLLVYESIKKQWLNPGKRKIIDEHEYFKLLFNRGVEFYNSSRQIEIEFNMENLLKKVPKPLTSKGSITLQSILKKMAADKLAALNQQQSSTKVKSKY